MKAFLLYIWQLPQNLLGLILVVYYRKTLYHRWVYCDGIGRAEKVLFTTKMRGGISLGKYIIVNNWATETDVKHELGHAVDSRRFGWLYLLIIGLPSIIWAGLYVLFGKKWNYYQFWTERRADKNSGIIRQK